MRRVYTNGAKVRELLTGLGHPTFRMVMATMIMGTMILATMINDDYGKDHYDKDHYDKDVDWNVLSNVTKEGHNSRLQ